MKTSMSDGGRQYREEELQVSKRANPVEDVEVHNQS